MESYFSVLSEQGFRRVYWSKSATWQLLDEPVAGVPAGEAALRLGHSVEMLLTTYAGVLEADEELANQRLEAALG